MDAGLVGGEGFAADGSIIRAAANRRNNIPGGDDHDWTAAPAAKWRPVLSGNILLPWIRTPRRRKEISLSDPASRLTAAVGKPAFFGWATNYLIDVKNAVIMDVAATPAIVSAEVNSAKVMINRVEPRFGAKPYRRHRLRYGEMVAWMIEEKAIEPHVPLWDKGERDDGTFSRSDFVFDADSNTFTCPGGTRLQQYRRNFEHERSGVTKANTRIYRASKVDCGPCALTQQCCPGQPMRKVMTSIHEAARDVGRRLRGTPDYLQSRRDRKKVEMLFAHLKRILKLDRLRLRGYSGAHDEFTLAAAAQTSQTGKARNPPTTNGAPSCMTKVVMTGSSAARSAKDRKPNGIINTKRRLHILPQTVCQRN